MQYTWSSAKLTVTLPTDPSTRVRRCKPSDSYYHNPVVIYLHNIMADYDKFRNHMEEPKKGIISEEDKSLIVNVGTGVIIGVASVTIGPSMAVLGGCLWAIDRVRRNS